MLTNLIAAGIIFILTASPLCRGSCEEIAVAAVCDRRSPSFARWVATLIERRYTFFTAPGNFGCHPRVGWNWFFEFHNIV
jgi:hypothetical protein